MNNLISFLSDFMNFWTLFDLVVIFLLTVLLLIKTSNYKQLNNELLFQKDLNTKLKTEHLIQLKVKNNQIGQMQSDLLSSKQNEVKLHAKINLIESCNQDNLKLITHWKERALHIKHTQKSTHESEKYICQTNIYSPNFEINKEYNSSNSRAKYDKETTLCLISESGIRSLVNKCNFKSA